MTYVAAAVAIGLYANAIVRALEVNTLGPNILRTACNLTADRETMPMQKSTISDRNIAAWIVRPRGVGFP